MYPPILFDGPGAELPGAGAAVSDLHRRLLARFSTQKALDEAYAEALAAAENDEAFLVQERRLTRFERVFRTEAARVHHKYHLPANAELFYEIP